MYYFRKVWEISFCNCILTLLQQRKRSLATRCGKQFIASDTAFKKLKKILISNLKQISFSIQVNFIVSLGSLRTFERCFVVYKYVSVSQLYLMLLRDWVVHNLTCLEIKSIQNFLYFLICLLANFFYRLVFITEFK